MHLPFEKTGVAAIISVAVSILPWAFFLSATTISVNDLFTFKFQFFLEKLATINFALFLILFPLTIAAIAAFAKIMEKKSAMLFTAIGAAAGGLVSMIAFPILQEFWLLGIFFLVSVPLMVETASAKYAELKSFVSTRTFMAAAGRSTMIIGIALFALSAVVVLPQQDQQIKRFEETFMENIFAGISSGKAQQDLAGSAADMVISAQKQAADSLVNNAVFEKLRSKTDPDVAVFVAATDRMRQFLDGDEYRQQIANQVGKSTADISKKVDIVPVIKKQMPFIETLERYLWAIQGFGLAAAFMLIANIVFKPAAVLYGLLLERIFGMLLAEKQNAAKPAQ